LTAPQTRQRIILILIVILDFRAFSLTNLDRPDAIAKPERRALLGKSGKRIPNSAFGLTSLDRPPTAPAHHPHPHRHPRF
jgi:hypothetical protein